MLISHTLFNVLKCIEREYILKGAEGIDIGMLKLFLLLYADDNLQLSLNILENYSKRWKLKVNTQKTKVMVFRKGGRLRDNISFYYAEQSLKLLKNCISWCNIYNRRLIS